MGRGKEKAVARVSRIFSAPGSCMTHELREQFKDYR
jgi:hypothetical protein